MNDKAASSRKTARLRTPASLGSDATRHISGALNVLPLIRVSSVVILAWVTAIIGVASVNAADFGPGFRTKSVPVDGGTVAVTVGGSGPPVVLIHGYAESSRMWKPLARALAPRFTVIAPDLPGFGQSSIPKTGLEMKTAAERLHAAINALGYTKVRVVGHDIGL